MKQRLIVRFSLVSLMALGIVCLTIASTPRMIASGSAPTATASLIPTLIPAGTSNAVWIPIERDLDGVAMVLVPAGCFMMGSSEEQTEYASELAKHHSSDAKREWFDNEKPAHEVCFDQPFWIDQTEVTQAQFRQFGGKAARTSYFTGDSLPVENITWFEAKAFCEARGARLPTEAEWEYAARGSQGLVFPWGNTFEGSRANSCDSNCEYDWKDERNDDGYTYTAPVGVYLSGTSWIGALNMSGNVWEWVSSLYQPYPYKADDGRESTSDTNGARTVRGGSSFVVDYGLRAAGRVSGSPRIRTRYTGFRCVRSEDSGGAVAGDTAMSDAAKQFWDAIFKSDKDQMLAVVCSAYKGAAEALLAAGGIPAGADVDLSGMTFTVAKENGDIGEVAVRGKIKVSFEGMSQEIDLAEMGLMSNLPMKNENGWKVCPYIP